MKFQELKLKRKMIKRKVMMMMMMMKKMMNFNNI
jgi:hypothetical protein